MARFVMRSLRSAAGGLLVAVLLCGVSAHAKAAVFYPSTFTLANGMQVIIVQNRLSPAVVQMVWYKVGATDDPVGHSGLAHYLEHMMFKGTQSVPVGAFSALIAGMGGDENAFTTHDYTAYHEIVAADHLADVMQLEADRMRNLRFDPVEALSERSVVASERQQRTDNSPQGLFNEKMATALFPNHPYGRPVIGWADEIARITPDEAASFYHAHYAPNNAVLVVSGNVDVADVLRLADGTFGRLVPEEKLPVRRSLQHIAPVQQKRVDMQDARVKQPFVVQRTIIPSTRRALESSYALEVLAELLSANEVGLLYRHFVMDRRMASGIDASFDSVSRGPSVFSFGATPAPGQDVRTLEKEMKAYVRRLASQGVSSKTVAEAKQRLQDSAIFARDRLMAPAEVLGASVVSGRSVQEVENWPARISAVTLGQVNAALRELVANPHSVTGILEPVSLQERAAP